MSLAVRRIWHRCPFRLAICKHLISPKTVANCSDLVVFCVDHNSGGAYKTMQYAKKMKANSVNLADTVELPTVG